MFMSGSSDCSSLHTFNKAACDKDSKCKWEKNYECSGMHIERVDYCRAATEDQNMMEGLSKAMFGARLDAQMKTCKTAKDEKACVYTKELDFSVCAKKTNSAVKDICTQAVAQNIATLPLKKGATYAIPASHNFDFTSSSDM